MCPLLLLHFVTGMRNLVSKLQRWNMQRSAINEPTWTGHHGTAGGPAPAQPRRFGNTVNPALRAALRAQQERREGDADGKDDSDRPATSGRRFGSDGVSAGTLSKHPCS